MSLHPVITRRRVAYPVMTRQRSLMGRQLALVGAAAVCLTAAPVAAEQEQQTATPVTAEQEQQTATPVAAEQEQQTAAPVAAEQEQQTAAPVAAEQEQQTAETTDLVGSTTSDSSDEADEGTRLAGVMVRVRRFSGSIGLSTNFAAIDGELMTVLSPEVVTGLMIRYFELQLVIGIDVALGTPPQGTNLKVMVRHELLFGTNIELSRRVLLHIRAGPRIQLLLSYGGLLSTGVSFHPRENLMLSLMADVAVVSLEVVDDPESERSHHEVVWSGGLSLALGFWL